MEPPEAGSSSGPSLVSFIASVAAKRGVRLMRALRAGDDQPQPPQNPLASISSEYELRLMLANEEELRGAAVMYEYLHPYDDPVVEGRQNGIMVMNAFRRAMKAKMLPAAYYSYFCDPFSEAGSITELRKNLSSRSLIGARYVFDYLCPEDVLPQTECEDDDAAHSRRISLRASLLNETDLALGWVTLLEFAAMRLVLRWSEMPAILRDGNADEDEELEEEEEEVVFPDEELEDANNNNNNEEEPALLEEVD